MGDLRGQTRLLQKFNLLIQLVPALFPTYFLILLFLKSPIQLSVIPFDVTRWIDLLQVAVSQLLVQSQILLSQLLNQVLQTPNILVELIMDLQKLYSLFI